jgi:hypothetical protein
MRDFVYLILKRRHTVMILLRLLAFLMGLWGFVGIFKILIWTLFMGLPVTMGSFEVSGNISLAIVLCVIGITIALTNKRLASWLVPMPRKVCPKCGYRLIRLRQPRCPECGLDLPHEFVDDMVENA